MSKLVEPFTGRDEEGKVIILTLLSREHAVLIGEPGTAKSAMIRRVSELLNAKFFSYLLTRFTEPSELFGPIDIKALEEGRYVRMISGKLPSAEIAFLDEIFKANSAILNALNTLLQERVLYDGYCEIAVPLWSLFGASNEVPEETELLAFYDRFLVKHFLKPVPENLWKDLLDKAWALEKGLYYNEARRSEIVMDMKELRKLHEAVLEVDLEPVKHKLTKLFAAFESRGIHISDRRKGKTLKVVASNAVLEGRSKAQEQDLLVLKYVVPKDWDELEKVNTVLSEELKTPYKYLKELNEIKTNLQELLNYVVSLQPVESKYVDYRFKQFMKDLEITRERVASIAVETQDRAVQRVVEEVLNLIEQISSIIKKRLP
ncbi:MAG: AAA family ATPase [Sulfolobales archaeon]|nr:MoxR family ATPase [Sulfolobales archaeon]MCX8208130.1 MoxR family ATPase [Sulfolobales archaeon]MDW8010541.1 AAA family ATPase [Sulfolobales archaeon]